MLVMEAVIVVELEVDGLEDAGDRRTAVGDAVEAALVACTEALHREMAVRISSRGGVLGSIELQLDHVQQRLSS